MMDRYQVRYAPQTLEDLKDIYVYIAQELHQRDTAAAQVNRIRAEIRSLDFLPLRYPCVDWEPWQSMGMRKVTVGNFLVFYIFAPPHNCPLSTVHSQPLPALYTLL